MPVEIRQPQLQTYEYAPYFWTDGTDGVVFMAPANGATTSGSSNPRSELREMVKGGGQEIAWNSGVGTHTLEVDLKITARPTRSDGMNPIVVAQIHDADDDFTVARLHGADLLATDGDSIPLGNVLIANYVLGTRFLLKLQASSAGVRYYINNVLKLTVAGTKEGCYFKTGAYTQANPSNGGSGSGEVHIYSVRVTHS
jgi:hypothetical protein